VYQTGVPNVKCTKMHQMYQNALKMLPCVLNTDSILSVPNVTGVPNVPTVSNVPKMTTHMPKSYLVYQQKNLILVYQPVYQT